MGYNTDFEGRFDVVPALTAQQVSMLKAFSEERHNPNLLPSYYCDWVPSSNGMQLGHNGSEKSYSYVEWLELLIKQFLIPWNRVVNGEVRWFGEDRGDMGLIRVVDNVVTTHRGSVTYK